MKALITAPNCSTAVAEVPNPNPGLGEIRIKVCSVALNPVDALYVAHPPGQPGRTIGSDIAGIVDTLGLHVTRWKVGDRVAGLLQGATTATLRPGGFAEYAILEEDLAIEIPPNVSFEDAATLPLCSLTAAQALFIRLEINAPFPSPFVFNPHPRPSPTILIYSAATSLGMFTLELARQLRTPASGPYRIFATASTKHHQGLISKGVEAVFDYRLQNWPEKIREASGGIDYAVDCISEDLSTARISEAFGPSGGRIAVIRKSAWQSEGVREDVIPVYGAAWSGLGHEIQYNGETLPASPSWKAFTVAFYKYLSAGNPAQTGNFPIAPNPVRSMPGGLERIALDGFSLLGFGKVADREQQSRATTAAYLAPISGEKLVYNLYDGPA